MDEQTKYITDQSIYTTNCKYGYVFSLRNPIVHLYYLEYLERKGIPKHIGLTDAQRKNFEAEIQYKINKGEIIVRGECGSYVRRKRSRSE
ncbi:MAG: hypothetical protein IJM87_07465 [Ruminococcus sp.]|nr:hypothetical protein [Ruminococcus sp.]